MIITKTEDNRWAYDFSGVYHHTELPTAAYDQRAIGHQVMIGDKLVASNPYSRKQCEILEKELNDAGFVTRIANHGETKVWSVAIIGKRDNGGYENIQILKGEKVT